MSARTDPTVSVIMPVGARRPWKPALAALTRAVRRAGPVEVLVIAGTQPSRQRNLAAQEARGEFLYFIDNDSFIQPETMQRLMRALVKSGAAAAGGPAEGGATRAWIDRIGELVLGSPIGSPLVYRRYRADGAGTREAGEKSLILCNLMVRKEAFLASGGFDPRLYPNEENEFINRLGKMNLRTVYVGDAVIQKPRDYSLLRFAVETFRYGRGRMEQIWTNPHAGDVPFLAAGVLAAGLAAFVVVHPAASVLAGVYAVVVLVEGIRTTAGFFGAATFTGLTLLRHGAYLCGMLTGALTGIGVRRVRVPRMTFDIERFMLMGGRARKIEEKRFNTGFLSPRRQHTWSTSE